MKKPRGIAEPRGSGDITGGPSCRKPSAPDIHSRAGEADWGRLQDAIRRMPDLEPPDLLLECVMRSVRTQRLSRWTRLLRWARSPRSITFTPLRAAPAAAGLIVVCLAFAYHALQPKRVTLEAPEGRVPVVLALKAPDARSVAVIGSFNGWRAQDCERRTFDGETHWAVTLLLPSGRHEYAFVVDGERFVPDPGAGFHEEDGFGNQNAVLFIGNGNGSSI